MLASQNKVCILRFVNKTPAPNRLRVLRAETRLTQYNAARKARISHNRFWRIENGYIEPTDDECARLARLFKVDVGQVFPSRAAEQAVSA